MDQKSTDGRLRYKKLHGSTRRGRTRSRRRTADYIPRDVLDSHSKLKNRPMMSGTLTMFHQPESGFHFGKFFFFFFFLLFPRNTISI